MYWKKAVIFPAFLGRRRCLICPAVSRNQAILDGRKFGIGFLVNRLRHERDQTLCPVPANCCASSHAANFWSANIALILLYARCRTQPTHRAPWFETAHGVCGMQWSQKICSDDVAAREVAFSIDQKPNQKTVVSEGFDSPKLRT